eukprot:TRINITY_DN5043_c0_g1_i1.p1 TRINITY_DN5043_c0_g1~~TRINITY_DN5043_c0_g1_i1.p1  ORF type:complete len:114 (-),score=21.58 TRINITY_DN5043_c0_g1_i1:286-627(-)
MQEKWDVSSLPDYWSLRSHDISKEVVDDDVWAIYSTIYDFTEMEKTKVRRVSLTTVDYQKYLYGQDTKGRNVPNLSSHSIFDDDFDFDNDFPLGEQEKVEEINEATEDQSERE